MGGYRILPASDKAAGVSWKMTSDDESSKTDYYDILLDARNNAIRSLEKALVTLSSGAIILSITFLHEIAPHPEQLYWMIISWSLLFSSLLLMLLVFILGVYACEKGMKGKDTKCFTYLLQFLEWASMFLFILGSVFFAIFAAVNLPK